MSLVNFLSRISARERNMLGALVLVGFMIWLSGLWRNWEDTRVRHRKVRLELNRQAVWLGDADRFEKELEDTLSILDPEKTFNSSELIALIDDLVRSGNLKHDLGAPVTEELEVFRKHTLKVAVKNAPFARLIEFERSLNTNYPYAALEDFSITANKADPRLLNAKVTITACQLQSEEDEWDYWYD